MKALSQTMKYIGSTICWNDANYFVSSVRPLYYLRCPATLSIISSIHHYVAATHFSSTRFCLLQHGAHSKTFSVDTMSHEEAGSGTLKNRTDSTLIYACLPFSRFYMMTVMTFIYLWVQDGQVASLQQMELHGRNFVRL
ncbi:hypothetical protein CY34DRAFT_476717 [Suillus luteus UH-Slu-Lm8-n1]|uniref:Uncharacterized protein n=1 Tax=Suillus luteus UH-Slu-Lm8-n1 TaxID=930992 RepID=A0A0D0AZ27_9AGAM|nr:hypothetical protein CY34DRAFT_476717 [Suillus luteus UH-Slu-Lm8-n1]